ncbi:MAG: ribosome biogenesis GTPase Der [Candidatus Doudnabacteria bacterium]|nr:ribosome biogenesis GTPase Der [Candidatus Doudnabacteria bacterium]
MRIPLVAIIGLPNSGKSTLYNKILHRYTALVHDLAGTTRDRAYGLTEWNGLSFYLIDTAGIVHRADSELEKNIQKQTAIAAEESDVIVLVVDGKTPVSDKDFQVAQQLTRLKKPIILAVNKIDARNPKTEEQIASYQKLGLDLQATSAVNGAGVGDLLDMITTSLETFKAERIEDPDRIKIAFLGKPNVGKSSLINALIKQERLLVHDKAGTTRSTVEIPFESNEHKFMLLDTAGIKRKWKQDSDVEAAAAFQSIKTLSHTDVALFVVDGSQEITVQDQVVASDILDQHKPVVLLMNKTDLLNEEQRDQLLTELPNYLPMLWFAPVLFTSAPTGQGLDLLLKFAYEVHTLADREVEPEVLDQFLDKIIAENMPGKVEDERAPKIYNIKQTGTRPPVFRITVNFPSSLAESWKRWFEKQFRLRFGFEGTPIIIKYIRKQ